MSGTRPKVYAAGPIAGHSYEVAVRWRQQVQAALPECEVLTPMRGKEYLRHYETMPLTAEQLVGTGADFRGSTLEATISSERAIYRRDTWDVRRSDLVLANFLPGDEAEAVSIGTVCEVYLAGYLGIPVVAVLRRNGPHDHPFVTASAWVVVETLTDAFHAARIALLLDDGTPTEHNESMEQGEGE